MTEVDTSPTTSRSAVTYAQAGLAVVAATVYGFRAVRTANGQGVPETDTAAHVLGATVAGLTGALAVAAAVLLLARLRRAAAGALALTLGLEVLVVGALAAPPRLVTALPLGLALALFLAARPGTAATHPGAGSQVDRSTAADRGRTAAAVVALVLMLPIGFQYLVSGLVVPTPDLFGMYALYAALLAGAAALTRRRSWWVLAVPPVASALWFLLIWLGGRYLGWQP